MISKLSNKANKLEQYMYISRRVVLLLWYFRWVETSYSYWTCWTFLQIKLVLLHEPHEIRKWAYKQRLNPLTTSKSLSYRANCWDHRSTAHGVFCNIFENLNKQYITITRLQFKKKFKSLVRNLRVLAS
jgi:hypothetical protein